MKGLSGLTMKVVWSLWSNQTKIESVQKAVEHLAADIARCDPEWVPGVDTIEALTAAVQA
jgi:hypothetical protein